MQKKLFRVLRLLLGVVLVLVLLAWGGSEAVIRICVAPSPKLDKLPPITKAKLRKVGKRTYLGRSWLEKREGVWAMYLEGDPYTFGYTNGKLTYKLLRIQEDEFLQSIRTMIPNDLILRIVRTFVAYHNCSLHTHIPREYKLILWGLSHGAPHDHTYLGPAYNKYMNYHAAHDISHLVLDTPLAGGSGCTGFAAWGDWTKDGQMLAGRNFDFETARAFDNNKVVVYNKPDKGIPFVSVGWPGFFGVVSGINREGIAITLYAGHASDPKSGGAPIAFVARKALQYGATIKQVTKIICDAKVFVSESFLVGSRKEKRFVVIEKSPGRCAVRQPKGQRILVANHFLTKTFAKDPDALEYQKVGTSLARFGRIDALVKRHKGKLTPEAVAAILRDRKARGDKDVGLGNRATLNALIATHSVIVNLNKMRLWVSASPHQIGKFVAFDILHFERHDPSATIAADPLLAKGFANYRSFRKGLKQLKKMLGKKQWKQALPLGLRLEKQNPKYYEILALLGKIHARLGKKTRARAYFQRALKAEPAYIHERKSIELQSKQLQPKQSKP